MEIKYLMALSIIEAWVSALAVGLLLGFGMLFVMIVLVFVLVL